MIADTTYCPRKKQTNHHMRVILAHYVVGAFRMFVVLRAVTLLLLVTAAARPIIIGGVSYCCPAAASAFHHHQQPLRLGRHRTTRRRGSTSRKYLSIPVIPDRHSHPQQQKGWSTAGGGRWPAPVNLCSNQREVSQEDEDGHENELQRESLQDADKDPRNRTRSATTSIMDIFRAALLIAGTTVGGGFLALPVTVVVPLGGFPMAAASLSVVWLFLLGASHLLCAAICACFRQTQRDNLGFLYLVQHHCLYLSRVSTGKSNESSLLMEKWSQTLTLALLVLLTEATLVSQLARAGLLLADGVRHVGSLLYYRLGCILTATAGAWLVQSEQRAVQINAALTVVFLLACAGVFHAGRASAVWSRCLDTTTEFNLATLGRAVSVQLQLLVYGEILPIVCHMLRYRPPAIGAALTLGSLLPLVLLTGWAALGVALVPPSAVTDPVTVLLSSPGPIQSRLYTLALSAIGTTVLGCYLALQSAYMDVILGAAGGSSQESDTVQAQAEHPQQTSKRQRQRLFSFPTALSAKRWFQTLVVAGPPTAIACISPALFERAIAFAGAYPVLLLYGLLPAGLTLLQAQRRNNKLTQEMTTTSRNIQSSKMNVLLAWTLGLLSLGMVGASAVADVQNGAKWIANAMLPK